MDWQALWLTARLAGIPMTRPARTWRKAPRSISETIPGRDAPSAMRIPISLVRRVATYDMTP